MYPWLLVLDLLADAKAHLRLKDSRQWPNHDDYVVILWACERCKHGRFKKLRDGSSEETPDHTRAHGCKFCPARDGSVPPGGVPERDQEEQPPARPLLPPPPGLEPAPAPVPEVQPPGTGGARSPLDPAPPEPPGGAPGHAAADVVEEATAPSTYIEPSFDLKATKTVLSKKEAPNKDN